MLFLFLRGLGKRVNWGLKLTGDGMCFLPIGIGDSDILSAVPNWSSPKVSGSSQVQSSVYLCRGRVSSHMDPIRT